MPNYTFKFSVENIFVKRNEIEGQNFRFKPVIKRENTTSDDKTKLTQSLSLKIESTKETPFPFDIYIVVKGESILGASNFNDKLIDDLTVILFPYLRTIVQQSTVLMQTNPVVLPLLNVSTFKFDENGVLISF